MIGAALHHHPAGVLIVLAVYVAANAVLLALVAKFGPR